MKGLLIKDIRLMMCQKKFFIVLLFVAALLGFNSFNSDGANSLFVVSYLTFVFLTFTISTFSYDEMDNGYTFLMTLPFKREAYAAEKYVFGVLLTTSAWIIGNLINIIIFQIKQTEYFTKDHIFESIILLPSAFVLISIMLPFLIKYGAEKGRIVMVVVVFGIVGFSAGSYYLMNDIIENIVIRISELIMELSKAGYAVLIMASIICSLLIMCVSYLISRGIVRKKEY